MHAMVAASMTPWRNYISHLSEAAPTAPGEQQWTLCSRSLRFRHRLKPLSDAYEEFYAGYGQNAEEPLERTFEELGTYDDVVVVRDIPFYSHCEHHMVPFIGKAHVAYYPTDKVVGLSKLARVVEVFARRLQTQERLTSEIVTAIDEALKPRGIAVMIEAEHQCMTLRGVRAHGASTVTTQFTGAFRDDPAEQIRFMTLVKGGHQTG